MENKFLGINPANNIFCIVRSSLESIKIRKLTKVKWKKWNTPFSSFLVNIDAYSYILGLPWSLRGSKVCLQCRRPSFNPWVRKISWKGITTNSSILAWRISWTEECGRLPFMALQRVRHDWATNTHTHSYVLLYL